MRQGLKSVALMIVATVVLFVLVEGTASTAFAAHAFVRYRDLFMATEQSHTQYDSLLGWASRPNLYLPDLYGKGVYLRTNAQGLRADHEYAAAVPPGRTRVICSGDSFTLGHDVSNDDAWCAKLERMDPRLETVNMGQAAYGVDQAYLWYARDGGRLAHDVQLFAFITSDFDRLRSDNFGGIPKPYLRVEHGALRVENTPVPAWVKPSEMRGRIRAAVRSLRSIALLRSLVSHGDTGSAREAPMRLSVDEARVVAARVFDALARLNAERGSTLVLVYLPKALDSSNRSADPWREFVHAQAARLGVPLIDLVEDYRKIPAFEGEAMFTNPFHPSHYDPRGNAWAATLIHDRLVGLSAVKAKLAAREAPAP